MKYGIKSITMDDLARHLGMSKKTIYKEFNNKEDLIRQVVVEEMESAKSDMELVQRDSKNAIEEMINMAELILKKTKSITPTAYYDLKKYYRPIWLQFEKLQTEYTYNRIKENIKWGIEEGLYREDIHPSIIARLYIYKVRLMTDEKIFSLDQFKRNELILQFISYHLHGIVSDKGLEKWKNYKKELIYDK